MPFPSASSLNFQEISGKKFKQLGWDCFLYSMANITEQLYQNKQIENEPLPPRKRHQSPEKKKKSLRELAKKSYQSKIGEITTPGDAIKLIEQSNQELRAFYLQADDLNSYIEILKYSVSQGLYPIINYFFNLAGQNRNPITATDPKEYQKFVLHFAPVIAYEEEKIQLLMGKKEQSWFSMREIFDSGNQENQVKANQLNDFHKFYFKKNTYANGYIRLLKGTENKPENKTREGVWLPDKYDQIRDPETYSENKQYISKTIKIDSEKIIKEFKNCILIITSQKKLDELLSTLTIQAPISKAIITKLKELKTRYGSQGISPNPMKENSIQALIDDLNDIKNSQFFLVDIYSNWEQKKNSEFKTHAQTIATHQNPYMRLFSNKKPHSQNEIEKIIKPSCITRSFTK